MTEPQKNGPDFKEVAATAGKLFQEIKGLVMKMLHDVKAKIPKSDDSTEQKSAPPAAPEEAPPSATNPPPDIAQTKISSAPKPEDETPPK